jgi:type II secretory ATPase GspE/PulE/Tfp pilus assembly ATPase PilB-like protein
VDGVLRDILPVPAAKASHIVSRIKVMAGMNITERRLPQDGHISARMMDGVPRDIRVGSSPTINGERLVLRIMPDLKELTSLNSLGFFDDQMQVVSNLLSIPYGLILVVGPVGAGKTTTLYSLLRELNQPDRSVVTIEDPVERRIAGANQIQIDPKTGLDFVTALRGVLRQDPNLMCIGEIRDPETARIACRAAMTGVTVLSTLHANDTASAVDVLRNFGIPTMAIADALRGVISQRLIRRIAPDFRQECVPTDVEKRLLKIDAEDTTTRIFRGTPNDANFQTGYSGRTAVFEVMEVNSAIREAIYDDSPTYKIAEVACSQGMITREDAGRRVVRDGVTSVEELRRLLSDTQLTQR